MAADFPMTASPIADGEVANSVRWWQRLINPINKQVAVFAADELTPWATLTLGSSWVPYGSPWPAPAYTRRRGIVYLRGLMKNGGGLSTLTTLPIGFRPGALLSWSMGSAGAGGTIGVARIDITAAGALSVQAYGLGGTNANVSLSGISFLAEG